MVFALNFGYSASDAIAANTYISDLQWTSETNGWNGAPKLDKANGDPGVPLNPISLLGQLYTKGIGCHVASSITYSIGGDYTTFVSDIGIDDEVIGCTNRPPTGSCATNYGSSVFQVWGDGVKLYDSGTMTHLSATKHINISVAGVHSLQLMTVLPAGVTSNAGDHTDWAGAYLAAVPYRPFSGASGEVSGCGTEIGCVISNQAGYWHIGVETSPSQVTIVADCPDGTDDCFSPGQAPVPCIFISAGTIQSLVPQTGGFYVVWQAKAAGDPSCCLQPPCTHPCYYTSEQLTGDGGGGCNGCPFQVLCGQ